MLRGHGIRSSLISGVDMYKIRKVSFLNHPVLGDLELDFSERNGNAVDTVILAGENGAGKSTVINALYALVTRTADFEAIVIFENDFEPFEVRYTWRESSNGSKLLYVSDESGMNAWIGLPDVAHRLPTAGIFSDVDINFHSDEIKTVTSLTLDEDGVSRRSTSKLPTQIKQLLIDIQNLDDSEVARSVRKNPKLSMEQLNIDERMPRFTTAFAKLFDNLKYDRIENEGGKKSIYFRKGDADIPIDGLSSGEKQIVYRGCFLLKDAGALEGAFVFVDEPEISLHPNWQKKILDYYKGLFTDGNGHQTSQLFIVTHSPFIIHNDRRRNDKVVVLCRSNEGEILMSDRAEYYKCESVEAVEDAFVIDDFSGDTSTVYLEGRTDELYFKKALEIYEFDVPFSFKWVGHLKENGAEEFTGKDALSKAAQFLQGQTPRKPVVFLFDCDTGRQQTEINNVYIRVIPYFESKWRMRRGIENALILDGICLDKFYSIKVKEGEYGEVSSISEFKKMELCEYICSLKPEALKHILSNLKNVIESLLTIYVG